MKENKNKRIITLLIVFTIVFAVVGGSLAYWTWASTENTNVTFTVAGSFACAVDGEGDITNENAKIIPTSNCMDENHAIKRTLTVTPSFDVQGLSISMNLWLKVNSIDPNLANTDHFRYAITTDPESCTNGLINEGTFKGTSTGSTLNLLENKGYTSASIVPETYYLYIWLDQDEKSKDTQNKSFSLSLGGECTDKIETTDTNVLSDKIISLAGNGDVVQIDTTVTNHTEAISVYPSSLEIVSSDGYEKYSNGQFHYDPFTSDVADGHITFNVLKAGKYQFCGRASTYGYDAAKTKVYINDTFVTSIAEEICYSFGILPVGTKIKVDAGYHEFEVIEEEGTEFEYSWTEIAGNSNFMIYRIIENETISAYKYQSENPNNYVKIDNEIWRILGVFNKLNIEENDETKEIISKMSIDLNYIKLVTTFAGGIGNGYKDMQSTYNLCQFTISDVEGMGNGKWLLPETGYLYTPFIDYDGTLVDYAGTMVNKNETCVYDEMAPEITECSQPDLAAEVMYNVYHTVFIDHDVIITGGDGSEGNPYTISKP